MNQNSAEGAGVNGVIKDAVLCIKTPSGSEMKLAMDAPIEKRIEFFSEVFDEIDPLPETLLYERPRGIKRNRVKPQWRGRYVRPRRMDQF